MFRQLTDTLLRSVCPRWDNKKAHHCFTSNDSLVIFPAPVAKMAVQNVNRVCDVMSGEVSYDRGHRGQG